jgi:hypothetical protein
VSLDLDEAVDVVTFDSFSSFRKRVNGVIGKDGVSRSGRPTAGRNWSCPGPEPGRLSACDVDNTAVACLRSKREQAAWLVPGQEVIGPWPGRRRSASLLSAMRTASTIPSPKPMATRSSTRMTGDACHHGVGTLAEFERRLCPWGHPCPRTARQWPKVPRKRQAICPCSTMTGISPWPDSRSCAYGAVRHPACRQVSSRAARFPAWRSPENGCRG